MTVTVTQPTINVREELADLRKPTGIAGEAMLRAETIIQQAALLGVAPNNIIKNGAMALNQRGSTSLVSGTGDKTAYGPDRFQLYLDSAYTALDATIRQTADGPSGFSTCLEVEVDTIEAVASTGDLFRVMHKFEGLDLQGLGWGTSAGKPLTLQFWVKSNTPGTYALYAYMAEGGGDITNFTYTINQSAVWQKVVWVIPPNTAAAPANDNTSGLEIGWILAAGTSYTSGGHATVGWEGYANNLLGNGQLVDLGAVDAQYFRMTGVQATIGAFPEGVPFKHQSYGEELALCQRYYSSNINLGNQRVQFDTYVTSGIYPVINLTHPTTMRASPTVTKVGAWTGSNIDQSTLGFNANETSVRLQADATGTGRGYLYPDVNGGFSCDAEL